jgi:membrane-bound metal-dependent hydrolase YbcI (DUF457 family)
MDPISHVSFGRLVVEPMAERLGPGTVVACVLGSLTPDVDLVVALRGWDVYLRQHQVGTHSLAGAIAGGIATALVVRTFRKNALTPLIVAGTVGCLGHLLLDLISGADIRLLWPASRADFTLPLFAMADPWLLGLLVVCALVAASARRSTGLQARSAGLQACKSFPRRAFLGLGLVAAVLIVRGALYASAMHAAPPQMPPGSFWRAQAVWGSWSSWVRYEASSGEVTASALDVGGGARVLMRIPRNLEDPLVRRSQSLDTVRNLMTTHDVTFARVEGRSNGTARVGWSDLRYCAPVDAAVNEGAAHAEPACALWFGGDYDERGRPGTTFVQFGPVMWRRTVAGADAPEQ